jgi:hypothetical protein
MTTTLTPRSGQRSGRRRAPLRALVVVAAAALLLLLAVRALVDRIDLPFAQESRCDLVGTPYSVSTEQAANAATISAVGAGRGLPRRAAVIALATALQESKLVNVEYGDRDSVGLFQQRPSQGWGTAEQILDPRYAAGRFYDALVRVRDWHLRPLTVAAQAVQHSAHPEAYQRWEDQATSLAKAFSGATPAAVSCAFPAPTVAATPARVATLLDREHASIRLATAGLAAEMRPAGSRCAAATWLVAYADRLGIDAVAHAGQRWSREHGWRPAPAAPRDRVRFEMARIDSP